MHSHWVMMAIKSKPCYPKVIKFGRSGKRERRPQRRKKFLKRGTRRKKSISSQTLQWQDYKRASEIVSRKREREREEKMSCENKKKRKDIAGAWNSVVRWGWTVEAEAHSVVRTGAGFLLPQQSGLMAISDNLDALSLDCVQSTLHITGVYNIFKMFSPLKCFQKSLVIKELTFRLGGISFIQS